jgi:hypothetical protein
MTYLSNTKFFRAGLLLAIAVVMSLATSAKAEAACNTANECFTAAEWQQAVADDYFNKGVWFREYSKQYFGLAVEWNQKATWYFHAGNASAAAWSKAVADDFSKKSVANAKAADEHFAQAQYWNAAANNDLARAMFIMAANGSNGCYYEAQDNSSIVGCGARPPRNSCDTQGHPSDPSWGTVCDRNYVAICDANRDGNRTYVDYYPHWSTQDHPSKSQYDSYGRTANGQGVRQFCAHEYVSDAAQGIQRFRVCVENEGCSRWEYPGVPD